MRKKEKSISKYDTPKMIESIKELDLHFSIQEKIIIYYKNREIDNNLETAIKACEEQIDFAPKAKKAFNTFYKNEPLPSHKGFEQLAIIKEKQGKFSEAISLCKIALNEGWSGDWERRIGKLNKKIN